VPILHINVTIRDSGWRLTVQEVLLICCTWPYGTTSTLFIYPGNPTSGGYSRTPNSYMHFFSSRPISYPYSQWEAGNINSNIWQEQ
jgi:hypothetical protein